MCTCKYDLMVLVTIYYYLINLALLNTGLIIYARVKYGPTFRNSSRASIIPGVKKYQNSAVNQDDYKKNEHRGHCMLRKINLLYSQNHI